VFFELNLKNAFFSVFLVPIPVTFLRTVDRVSLPKLSEVLLREAKGKANKAWRVLHRVTYVERPALMGFGRDVRQLAAAESTDELSQLKAKVETLENQNAEMLVKLNAILNKLD
jgi:hypothetical protein